MLLIKTSFWIALVAVSYKPSDTIMPAAFDDVREVKNLTLEERFTDRLDCINAIQNKLSAIPEEYITRYKVMIEQNQCKEQKVQYWVPAPLPKRRPTI